MITRPKVEEHRLELFLFLVGLCKNPVPLNSAPNPSRFGSGAVLKQNRTVSPQGCGFDPRWCQFFCLFLSDDKAKFLRSNIYNLCLKKRKNVDTGADLTHELASFLFRPRNQTGPAGFGYSKALIFGYDPPLSLKNIDASLFHCKVSRSRSS